MRNFAWIATWKITHRCNLRCIYCDHREMTPASSVERFDRPAIVERLASLKPKFVNISGGEPTLVEELPAVLKQLKSAWNPRIYVVHNGTQPHLLLPLMPHLDRIVVSIDGPGEVNRRNRGIDGNRVIDNLDAIVPEAARNNVEIALNCVVTKENAPFVAELAQRAADVSSRILLCLSPVMPPKGPLSILSDPALYKAFRAQYDRMRGDGLAVIQTFDNLLMHDNFDRIQCYNQFFGFRVSPEGRLSSCAMNMPDDMAAASALWKKTFRAGGLRKAASKIRKWLNNRVREKIDFSCTTICYCESWLDLLFLNRTNESIPVYVRGLASRLTDEEYGEVDRFVRAHINPSFDIALFRSRIEDAR